MSRSWVGCDSLPLGAESAPESCRVLWASCVWANYRTRPEPRYMYAVYMYVVYMYV